jgi:NADPH:quinone reductase-like Zn-dependent oxidoreductase
MKSTKAVVLGQYNKNIIRALLGLKSGEVTIPPLSENDLLIKVYAAPCNPSDIAFLQGGYNIIKPLPAIPGFEGAGVVEDTGSVKTKHLVGKRVSFFIQSDIAGSWAQYTVVNKDDIIVLNEKMDMKQAACFAVNPLTAYALMEIAEKQKTKAVVQNASGGQVAAFVRKMAHDKGMEVIDIVRKDESAKNLISEGAKYVLNENSPDFEQELNKLCLKTGARIAFDAVGGKLGGIMFNAMPENSKLVVYGGLSNRNLTEINTMDVIFKNKQIVGFNLPHWKNNLKKDEFDKITAKLQEKFISGEYFTKIQGETSIDNIVRGLRDYITNMSAGKILIVP